MKNRLFDQPIETKRAAIRQRLDDYRLSRKPVCHMAMTDDDYAVMLGESLDAYDLKRELTALELVQLVDAPAYEIVYGLKLVPLSEARAHRESGACTRHVVAADAA